jgi:FSR family fosmidomycin resistance protein-like MFS transporter
MMIFLILYEVIPLSSYPQAATNPQATVFSVLFAISIVHLLNDSMQSVVPAMFPIFHQSLHLSYAQIGWIAFALNITASMLQPLVGYFSDAKQRPYMLPLGVVFSMMGMVMMALATSFTQMIFAVICLGFGSSIFHPESSRVVYVAAGARRGLAQSIFQTGGNIGQALAPVFTALIFVPLGQFGIIWFTFAAGAALIVQIFVARWYRGHLAQQTQAQKTVKVGEKALSTKQVGVAIFILIMLLFSKFFYLAAMTGFYSFYLMDHFQISTKTAQLFIFALLISGSVGTFLGGPMADRFGRRNIIWFSILGVAPFSMLVPYANMFWTAVLLVCIGFILLCSVSVIVVYAQELVPGKVGTISGLFFGISFGLAGIGSAVVGHLADLTSISFVIHASAYLPLLGILAIFLPKDNTLKVTPTPAAVESIKA